MMYLMDLNSLEQSPGSAITATTARGFTALKDERTKRMNRGACSATPSAAESPFSRFHVGAKGRREEEAW